MAHGYASIYSLPRFFSHAMNAGHCQEVQQINVPGSNSQSQGMYKFISPSFRKKCGISSGNPKRVKTPLPTVASSIISYDSSSLLHASNMPSASKSFSPRFALRRIQTKIPFPPSATFQSHSL